MSRSDFIPAENHIRHTSHQELHHGVEGSHHHLKGFHDELHHHAKTHGGHGNHQYAHLHGHHSHTDTAHHHLPSVAIDHHGTRHQTGTRSYEGRESHRSSAAPSQTGFSEQLLRQIGAPVTAENLRFLDIWHNEEGGAKNNPLNTSMRAPGAYSFNRDGVKVYPGIDTGIHATAATLMEPAYRGILSALREGHSTHQAALALAHSPWGTHNITYLV